MSFGGKNEVPLQGLASDLCSSLKRDGGLSGTTQNTPRRLNYLHNLRLTWTLALFI